MRHMLPQSPIQPHELAFDIDGVVADTMAVFVRLAHERYGLREMSQEDITCFDLRRCLDLDGEILNDLICTTLDDEHTLTTPPVPGAPEVLTALSRYGPLRFVTARIWPESIVRWLHRALPDVPPRSIEVVATGDPAAKLAVLRDFGARYFVDDRLETCEQLASEGLHPILFDQPWNRAFEDIPFPRVRTWHEIQRWVLPSSTNSL